MRKIIIYVLAAAAIYFLSVACGGGICGATQVKSASTVTDIKADSLKTVKLKPAAFSCAMCEKPIETALLKQNGIRSAKANYATKTVTVTYNPRLISSTALNAAVKNWSGSSTGNGKKNKEECATGASCEKPTTDKKSCCAKG